VPFVWPACHQPVVPLPGSWMHPRFVDISADFIQNLPTRSSGFWVLDLFIPIPIPISTLLSYYAAPPPSRMNSLGSKRQRSPSPEDLRQRKYTALAEAEGRLIQCGEPTCHGATFPSVADFEEHYALVHKYVCAPCGASFPSAHLLELHHEERHDPYWAVRREQGLAVVGRVSVSLIWVWISHRSCSSRQLRCLEEECSSKRFATPKGRRLHLIDRHAYPREYDFAITLHGILIP
jgi:DNA-directed RNA polymerase subunit RPC12/RpoP